MNKTINILGCLQLGSLLLTGASCKAKEPGEQKPNIIFILADDMGYADPSCYGQKKFDTPNIDQMAKQGIRFTQHYAGSSVCAPSRSSLLTGQHTGHTPIRGNKEIEPEGQAPLPASTVTIAKLLKQNGYITGAFGKWGLGFVGTEGDPNAQGFDEFFGYNCQRYAHRYYPAYLWHNSEKVNLPGNDWTNCVTYSPDVIHEKAMEFITQNANKKPFFLFLPYTLPHAELIVPDDSIFKKFKGKYPETPYLGKKGAAYGKGIGIGTYCPQPYPHATYAAMVYRYDKYVGDVLKLINKLGISKNTLVIFTSDNGPSFEAGSDPDFFQNNGGFRGYKRDLYEGGIREPFIACWPGKIKPGTESNLPSAFWDMFPTLADAAGIKNIPTNDGISILPTLLGNGKQEQHPYFYWEFHELGGRQAVRMGDWKGVRLKVKQNPDGPIELYNLATDPTEKNNVANSNPDIVKKINDIMKDAHTPSALFNYGTETYMGD